MDSVITSFQTGYRRLVPKFKYCGKPKLPESEIEYVKKLEAMEKQNEKAILDIENEVNNPNNFGRIKQYYQIYLSILNKFKHKVSASKNYFKQNRDVLWSISELKKERTKDLDELEKTFERASSHR